MVCLYVGSASDRCRPIFIYSSNVVNNSYNILRVGSCASSSPRDVRDEKTNGESTNKKILRCLLVVSLVVSLVVLLVTLLAITSIYRKCALVST